MATTTKRNGTTRVAEATAEAPSIEVGDTTGREMVPVPTAGTAPVSVSAPTGPAPAPPDNLFAALSRAQGMVKAVPLDRRNTFHKYKYASAESLIAEGSEALSACGLALVPVSQAIVNEGRDLHRRFLLVHRGGDSLPLEIVCPVLEEKGRPIDKAMWGACTQSLGYLLRDLLLMPRVDEKDEPDARGEHVSVEQAPRGRAAPTLVTATSGETPAPPPNGVKAKPGEATADQLARMVRVKQDWFALAGLDKEAFSAAWSAEVKRFGVASGTDLLPAQADELIALVVSKVAKLEAEREVDRQIALDREDALAREAGKGASGTNADAIPY